MTAPSQVLENVTGRYARTYTAAVRDLLVARILDNCSAARDALDWMERITTETMGVAEVLGAAATLRAVARTLGPTGETMRADRDAMLTFAELPDQTILPRVTLTEALQDLVDRTPVTLRNTASRVSQQIAKLYSSKHVVAFAKSIEQTVTEQAQRFLASAFKRGLSESTAGKGLAKAVDQVRKQTKAWSEGYSRMVFRTNFNTATTAGRFRATQDPAIRQVIPAFMFESIGDADTRDNHDAADGIILRVDNPAWAKIAPPLGYNCRCLIRHVSRAELESTGRIGPKGGVRESRIPRGAFPDPGFRHRVWESLLIPKA